MDIMVNILHEYDNGNYNVKLYEDGTKVRQTEADEFIPSFPESIDVKITNKCDLNCQFCHEQSDITGSHADLIKLLDVLSGLSKGIELAIGGGNPLSHPDLLYFLQQLKKKGFVANITVNQKHIAYNGNLLKKLITLDLVKGIGISINNTNFKDIIELKSLSNNIVFHLIAGINNIYIIDELIKLGNCKILVLGYKQFGRGINYYSEQIKNTIEQWYKLLPNYLQKCTISFDNLALEQLNVKRLLTEKAWNKFYMGDDFCYTMYIDAVNQQYAPTSRSNDRKLFDEISLLSYFKNKI